MKYPINVTFDTNIFDANQFDLGENSSFSQLQKYVHQGKIKVYLSNIVLDEMKKHCAEYAKLICVKIRKLKDEITKGKLTNNDGKKMHRISNNFINAIEFDYLLEYPNIEQTETLAKRYLQRYIDSLDVKMLNSEKINFDDIFSAYFQNSPPFEMSENKKYEFPDAVIAAQIKSAFNNHNPVHFITADKGLTRTLEDCDYCILHKTLNDLFKTITESENEYKIVCNIVNKLLSNIGEMINQDIDDDTNISLDGMRCDKDGNLSGFDYDEIYYHNCELNSTTIFAIDYFDDEVISVRLRCKATIEAECTYYDYENSLWDSEEKNMFFLIQLLTLKNIKQILLAAFRLIEKRRQLIL